LLFREYFLIYQRSFSYNSQKGFPLTKSLTPENLKDFIEAFLDEKKAQDIVSIDLRGRSSLADFLVIATGTSQRQVGSMAELLREELKKKGYKNIHIEGLTQCDWVLVDVGDVIVHLFREEIRHHYNLEEMWHKELKDSKQKIALS
jgi:ribosome-associated protein